MRAAPLALLVMSLVACGAPPAASTPPPAQAVTVTAVHAGVVERWIEAVGTLEAREEAVVANGGAAAAVVRVCAEVGDTVAAGAVVAELDDRDLQVRAAYAAADRRRAEAAVPQAEAQVAEARANEAQVRADLTRAEGLAPGGLVAAEVLDARRAAVTAAGARTTAAVAAVAVAQADLARIAALEQDVATARERLRLTAPVAGLVLSRTARAGATAAPGEPLFTMAVAGAIEARVEVPETALPSLALGQSATVRAGAATWEGRIRLVEPRLERTARTAWVRMTLAGAAPRHIGASVTVRVAVGHEEGMVIPLAAVRGSGAEAAVLVAEPAPGEVPSAPTRHAATVRRVPVVVGSTDGARVVLHQGPPEGAWVIAVAQDFVSVDGPCIAILPEH